MFPSMMIPSRKWMGKKKMTQILGNNFNNLEQIMITVHLKMRYNTPKRDSSWKVITLGESGAKADLQF